MNGLVWKDLYSVRIYIVAWLIPIASMFLIDESLLFMSGISSVMLVSSLFYQEEKAGFDKLVLCLPYDAKEVVWSKYCVVFGSGIFMFLFTWILVFLLELISQKEFQIFYIYVTVCAYWFACLVVLPIHFTLPKEVYYRWHMGIEVLINVLVYIPFGLLFIGFDMMLTPIFTLIFACLTTVLLFIVAFISMKQSLRGYEKKMVEGNL